MCCPVQEVVSDMPPSWVPKLSIPRDTFDMRCPRGSKLTLYHRAQHEIFALFGECNRYDGMVEKLVLYEVSEGLWCVSVCVCRAAGGISTQDVTLFRRRYVVKR
jgi:hypothetical protein